MKSIKLLAVAVAVSMVVGCASPRYCKEEERSLEWGTTKCAAAVGADVVLVALAVAAIAAGADSAKMFNDDSNSCDIPSDRDKAGNMCGARSALSRPGGKYN